MKQWKQALCCLCMAALLLTALVLTAPTSSMAHITDSTSWSVPMPVAQREVAGSELLTPEGLHVMLGLMEESRKLEIPVTIPEGMYWYVTATCSDTDSLSAWVSTYAPVTSMVLEGIDNTQFCYGGGKQSVTLEMMNLLADVYEEGETVTSLSAEVTLTLTYLTLPPETEEMVETVTPMDVGSFSATFHVPLRQGDEYPPTGTLSQCPTQYHPAAVIPLVNGETVSQMRLYESLFPPMTQYTIDGEKYLLYDEGTIVIPANATVMLDLSKTEVAAEETETEEVVTETETTETETQSETETVSEETEETTQTENEEAETEQEADRSLTLLVGGREYTLAYAEAPLLEEDVLIMKGSSAILPLNYYWAGIAPTAAVEQLKNVEGVLIWEEMDASVWSIGPSGTKTVLSAAQALQAGTYRLTLTWVDEEITLHRLKTEFYVRSGNAV